VSRWAWGWSGCGCSLLPRHGQSIRSPGDDGIPVSHRVTARHFWSLIAMPHTETNYEINWSLTCAVQALTFSICWYLVEIFT
jgi:hypothetical protein